MRNLLTVSVLCLAHVAIGCRGASESPERSTARAEAKRPPAAGPIPEAWVQARVAAAAERLSASEAGRLIAASIDAHGGLATWLRPGTVQFEFDYRPLGQPERRMHTRSDVDLWRARARQEELADDEDDGAEATFGWDGEQAWIVPDADAFPATARFWSTTPYYFIGIPFVLADPGARYERLEDAQLDGVVHRLVKVGYETGTGDSPDDYYILYLHPETHRVAAIRYIVSFPGRFAPGEHSPEKLMRYGEFTEVDGLWLARHFDTFGWSEEHGIGDLVTRITAGSYRFGRTFEASHFAPAPAAVVADEL